MNKKKNRMCPPECKICIRYIIISNEVDFKYDVSSSFCRVSSPVPYSKYAADALTLPVKAILKSISVFDLHSVHMLRKNTPQVLFKV